MKAITVLSFCLLLYCDLQAGIEKFLKKAENKTAFTEIRNIDFLYMINLDKRPDKYAESLEVLSPYNIIPYRFSAVNGWELTPSDLQELGVKYRPWMAKEIWGTYYPEDGSKERHELMHVPGRSYFSHCLSKGAIGIVLSHCSILKDAYDSGYETIWIMEDDIEPFIDPHYASILIDRLDRLVGPKNWDILFTDPDTKNNEGKYVSALYPPKMPHFSPNYKNFKKPKILSADFKSIGARFGAYSMIVRRSGMRKILKLFNEYNIFLPYDLSFSLPHDIKMIGLNYDFVSTKLKAGSNNGIPP